MAVMIDALPIFPCNLAKTPLSAHGFKSARRGAKWKHWPLVGFRTGEASGVDVLDIDPTGRGWYDLNFDALPSTRAHETQRGLHLLFKHADGLRSSAGKIAEGIDIRADGGYAIWWPATGRPIEDWPICEWPEWLLAEAGYLEPPRYPSKRVVIPTLLDPLHDPALAADCTAALWEMSAEDWRGKHDEWFELLMGCKAVGITLTDFVGWCISDPQYTDDAEIIERKWHSVEAKHGGAFWRELSRWRIRLGKVRQGDNLLAEVPRRDAITHTPSRNPSARLNYIARKIEENPTERALSRGRVLLLRFASSVSATQPKSCASSKARPCTRRYGKRWVAMAFAELSAMRFGKLRRRGRVMSEVVNLTDRLNARQRKRNMDLQHLDEAIGYLQLVRNNKAQFDDIAAKLPRLLLEIADRQEELSNVKRELATAQAGRTQAMLDNERQHNEIIGQLQPQLRELQKEIADAKGELEGFEKKIAEARAYYDSILRGINALKDRLNVKVA